MQRAIDAYDIRQIDREMEQLILLDATAPELVTPRDRAKLRILEKQRSNLGSAQ